MAGLRSGFGTARPLPAAAFGLATWSIAHALTYLLFAHIHTDPVPRIHLHGGIGPVLIAAAGFLATASLASAMPTMQRTRRRGRRSDAVDTVLPASLTGVIAPAVFLTVEFGQHAATGDEGPPALLLVLGVVLHTAMGAITPLLWSDFVGRAARALLAGWSPVHDVDARQLPAGARDRRWAGSRLVTPLGGRAPPPLPVPFT